MTRDVSRFRCRPLPWFTLGLLLLLALPWPYLAATTLASQALSVAVAKGNLDEIVAELLMDSVEGKKYEIDESGIEELGRRLLQQGNERDAIQILQLNQGLHPSSAAAAVALADAYRESGDDLQASSFYDMALNLDPDNEAARRGGAETGNPEQAVMGAMARMGGSEFDAETMQEAMAQMGHEIPPEQMEEMRQAMAQLEEFQNTGQMPEDLARATQRTRQTPVQPMSEAKAEQKYESEQCQVLHRFNAHKRILDAETRHRVTGNYQEPARPEWTWNVESYCGDFLVAVPLWADVGPPVLELTDADTFVDSNGATWKFEMGKDGEPKSVVRTDPDGTVTRLQRLGDPRSFD